MTGPIINALPAPGQPVLRPTHAADRRRRLDEIRRLDAKLARSGMGPQFLTLAPAARGSK